MAERRRVLVALVVRGALGEQIDGLRRALGSRDVARIAPHITLVPPRNVTAANPSELERHLREVAARSTPLTLRLGPPARFANARPVLYLAVSGDTERLSELADDLAHGPLAEPHGYRERPFVAHVTLSSGLSAPDGIVAERLLGSYSAAATIETLTLLEQRTGEAGHPWEEVGDVRLGRPLLTGRGGRELEFHVSHHLPADLHRPGDSRLEGRRGSERLVLFVTEQGRAVASVRAELTTEALLVTSFEVEEPARGLGVGSQLLAFVERIASERGLGEVAVLDGRSPAFLEHHGYRRGPLGAYVRAR